MSSVAGPNRVGSLWVYGFEGGRSVRKTCGMAARKSHAPEPTLLQQVAEELLRSWGDRPMGETCPYAACASELSWHLLLCLALP